MIIAIGIGVIFGIIIACIVTVIACEKPEDLIDKPATTTILTNEQAVQKLQEIKPYYAYKGRTWTALDMAIRTLQEGEDDRD